MCWKIYIVIRIFVCICLEEYLFPSPKFLRVTVSSTFKYTIQKAKVRSLDRRLNSPTAILLHIPRCIIHPELRNLRRPIPIPSRLSILHDVPLSCITACIEGRGRRSADPLCFDRDFRRPPLPPSSSLLEKIEARGKRRRRSARLVAFRGLWKCVHVECDPRDENRKSRVPRPSLLKGPRGASPRSSPPSSRLGLFFWSPAGGYGFNNWGGNRGRNPKKVFSEVCVSSYRGEISSLPFFFCGDISLEFGILLLIRFLYGLYECSLWVDKRYSNCFSCFLLFWVYF